MTPPKLRACSTCARLKMKCRWPDPESSGGTIEACSRCARMKLACHVPEPVDRKRRGKSTRVAQLEEKINGIVNLLAQQQQLPERSSGQYPISPASQNISESSPAIAQDFNSGPSRLGSCQTTAIDPLQTLELIPGFCVTIADANAYLDVYREEYMPRYPYVIIPRQQNASVLYREAPTLFWVIMTIVIPQNGPMQMRLRNWAREHFSQQIIVKQERTLEMLQSILIYLTWSIYQYYVDLDGSGFMYMAVSIVTDMRLDKNPSNPIMNMNSLLGAAWTKLKHEVMPKIRTTHTIADQRAVLGLYHLSSVTLAFFNRGPYFPWTNYLTQCCQSITEAQDNEMDALSIALIRMMRIAEQGYAALPTSVPPQASTPIIFGSDHEMIISLTRRELESFMSSLPSNLQATASIQLQYQACLARIYESLFTMKVPPQDINDKFLHRTEHLWNATKASKQFIDLHLNLSFAQVVTRPYTQCALLAYAIVSASRIALLEAEDWQPSSVQPAFDYSEMVRLICDQFEGAVHWAREAKMKLTMTDEKTFLLSSHAHKMRWIQSWFIQRVSEIDTTDTRISGISGVLPVSAASAASAATAATAIPNSQSVYAALTDIPFMDDQSWQEFMLFQMPHLLPSSDLPL